MADFPSSPNIGDLHTNASGMTYEYTAKGVWRAIGRSSGGRFTIGDTPPTNSETGDYWHDTSVNVLKIYDRNDGGEFWSAISGTAVSATAPTSPVESMLWFNTEETNLYRYAVISGTGKWQLLASAVLSSTQTVISRALPLMWLYDDERFNFEFFIDDPNFNYRNITPRKVIDGVANDDTLDVEYVEDINTGQNYIIYSASQGLLDVVRVNSRLSSTRLKLQAIITHNYGRSGGIQDAYLARTSYAIQPDGTAIVKAGDVFFTRPLNALEMWPDGQFAIRRSAQGSGEFKVEFKYPDATIWNKADLLGTRSVDNKWRDEIYTIPTTGIIEFRITYTAAAGVTETLQHMALFGAPQNNDSNRVERPTNVSPANQATGVPATPTLTGSPYRSIYGLDRLVRTSKSLKMRTSRRSSSILPVMTCRHGSLPPVKQPTSRTLLRMRHVSSSLSVTVVLQSVRKMAVRRLRQQQPASQTTYVQPLSTMKTRSSQLVKTVRQLLRRISAVTSIR